MFSLGTPPRALRKSKMEVPTENRGPQSHSQVDEPHRVASCRSVPSWKHLVSELPLLLLQSYKHSTLSLIQVGLWQDEKFWCKSLKQRYSSEILLCEVLRSCLSVLCK